MKEDIENTSNSSKETRNVFIGAKVTPTQKEYINPEKPDVPLNKNDAFQKVQKRRVQEKR